MATEFRLPELGENIKAGDVVKVLVAVGDIIAIEQPVLEMETDKAVIEVPSSIAGKVTQLHVKAGDKVSIGQLILTMEGETSAPPKEAEQSKPAPAPTPKASISSPAPSVPVTPTSTTPVAAAPSVRQFAREIGIDIAQVSGAAAGERISIEDVKKYAKQLLTSHSRMAVSPIELPDFSKWGAIERQPMTNVRRKTAEHMTLAWTSIPHVTQFDWANITDLEERRKKLAPKVEKAGAKLTITAILIKIVAAALKGFPKFNASIDMAKQRDRSEKVLFTSAWPLTRNAACSSRSFAMSTKRTSFKLPSRLHNKPRRREPARSHRMICRAGRSPITNLGGIGGTHFTPIVNFPEVAILGVGRARMEPSYQGKDGCCRPRLMLPLSLSYDHRLIDGADGARFLRWIVEAIEEPLLIPLEG